VLAALSVTAFAASDADIAAAAADIAAAVENCEEKVSLLKHSLTASNLYSAMELVFYNHPEFFYLAESWGYSYNSNKIIVEVELQYRYNLEDIPALRYKYDILLNDLIDKCDFQDDYTDFEYVLAAHETIVANYTYDKDLVIETAYEMLNQGEGICEAYALLFFAVMQYCGIECEIAINAGEHHCWNLVKIDGEWYHVDLTWDDPITSSAGYTCHNYFMISDSELAALNAKQGSHTSWEPAISAGGTEYSFDALQAHIFPLYPVDGNWYSFDKANATIGLYDPVTLYYDPLYTISDIWFANPEKTRYWPGCFSGFAVYEDRMYFNTPTAIKSVNLDGGDERIELEPELGGLNIYNMEIMGDSLIYYVAPTPNDDMTAVKIDVPEYLPPDPLELTATASVTLLRDDKLLCFGENAMSVKAVKSLFVSTDVVITDANGEVITSGIVGTGAVVTSTRANVSAQLTVVVTGDLTGDGVSDNADRLAICAGLASIGGLDHILELAADINADSAATTADILIMSLMLKGEK
jgi:hypothetical protein